MHYSQIIAEKFESQSDHKFKQIVAFISMDNK